MIGAMNCSKCGKSIAAGATKCGACGTESSYSYDLAPEEEEKGKKEEPAAFMLPPGVSAPSAAPPPAGERPARQPRAERSRGASNATLSGGFSLKTLGIGGGVLLILILLGMKMCGGPSVQITIQNKKSSGTANVSNNTPKAIPFQLVGEASYTFKVEALDGDVLVGVPQRGGRDKITPELIKGWGLTAVKKGETQDFNGKLGTGSYSFLIATDSKKIVRAKFEYQVK